jgi:fructokinase
MDLYGGIEAGGTKFVCTVGSGPQDIRATIKYPTTQPGETIRTAVEFFQSQQHAHGPLAAIGVAAFGPLDPHRDSPTYGFITSTPKPGWKYVDLVGALQQSLPVPIGFDTDVNGAALGEMRWGAAQGLDTFIYLTIGTGIGGGAVVDGRAVHGMLHPEMGHIRLPHDWQADPFPGGCPYHGDCLEGMANGPAIEKRWGQRAETLPVDHPAWELEADYLAYGLASLVCALSPQRIIMGGGVMQQAHLFPLVRQKTQVLLNGYVQAPQVLEEIDQYIVPPGLGSQSGMLGAIVLAEQAAGRQG